MQIIATMIKTYLYSLYVHATVSHSFLIHTSMQQKYTGAFVIQIHRAGKKIFMEHSVL